MDGPRLAAIEKVSVKIIAFADETETETEIVKELILKVETVERYNDTALVFLMANNQALFVWNGETVYKDANGTLYPVCEATATCAALYVDDNDEKEQLEEKANAALEAGGFTEAIMSERRRLEKQGRQKGSKVKFCSRKNDHKWADAAWVARRIARRSAPGWVG